MKHQQLNKSDLPSAIKNTDTYISFPVFKQGLTLKNSNIDRLYDYYGQACRLGIGYIKQNPNLFSNDVKIIEEILNT